jgi:putative transposase
MPYYRLYYHVIWTTKGRESSITQSNRSLIYNAISSKVDGLGGIVHALNGMEDHVHLVVTIPPKIAIGSFIRTS